MNYPNPFRSNTTIKYNLSKSSMVSIDILDLNGRVVATNGTLEATGVGAVIADGEATVGDGGGGGATDGGCAASDDIVDSVES